ncbi:MAG: hypothetical protein IJU65_01395 [Desulfovibrio sp.]|nr:hypothetical protein [Desulfovibrio sp.]
MAIVSFCLGAASVVVAAYTHKFIQERKEARKARFVAALLAIRDGGDVPDNKCLNELYKKGWIADVHDGRTLTAAGVEFLTTYCTVHANSELPIQK